MIWIFACVLDILTLEDPKAGRYINLCFDERFLCGEHREQF